MDFDAFGKAMVSIQHKVFYFLMSLARFNLYANSWGFLLKTAFQPKRALGGRWWWWAEVFSLGLFFCWFGVVLSGCGSRNNMLLYLVISHMAASPVHVQVRSIDLSLSQVLLGSYIET